MILSKGNLQIVELVSTDSNQPSLDNVFIRKDGTTIACNGRAIIAVSPVPDETLKNVPIEQSPALERDITLSSDTAKVAARSIGKDTLFGGLLEYCDIEDHNKKLHLKMSDGSRSRSIEGHEFHGKYIDYKSWFEKGSGSGHRVVLNRKRLLALLKTLEHVCPDESGEFPIFLEIMDNGAISIRGLNRKNGQRVLAIMGTYDNTENKWMEVTEWERELVSSEKSVKKSQSKVALNLKPSPKGLRSKT